MSTPKLAEPRPDVNRPSFAELSASFNAIAELMQATAEAAERDLARWQTEWRMAR